MTINGLLGGEGKAFASRKRSSREGFILQAEEQIESVYIVYVYVSVQKTSYYNLIKLQKSVYVFLYPVNHSYSLCMVYFNSSLQLNITMVKKYKRYTKLKNTKGTIR